MATFAFSQDGEVRRTSRSFYRGENTNFHPTNASFQGEAAISSYVMRGWIPKERFVTRETAIVAFGSCFASNISNYLHERNYNVLNRGNNDAYVTKLGDGMVNTYAILQQFAWAWEGLTPQADVWHGKKAEDFAYDESVRLETKELFDNADLFIITLGLSELWYDKPTGEVFWRAVPTDVYDPQRHCFRTASHAETLHNFHRIYELIRRYRPTARILFSVSPIPLTATFRPISCITADAVSKATIRSALDEFLQTHGEADGVYYFPSYEAVKRIFHYQWGEDRRHVRRDVLDFNMKLFEHYYCSQGIGADEVRAAYDHAWELDHNRAENVRQRDAVSYEERRAITKQAKINARIEARRVEREKVLNERREERLRQAQLHRRAKTWVQKAMKTKSATFVQYATQAVIALFALDSLTDWMDWIPLVFE